MVEIKILEGLVKLYTLKSHIGHVQNLLIYSHGDYYGKSSWKGISLRMKDKYCFNVPLWTTLYFYGPHKLSLQNNFEKLIKGHYKPFELKMPGDEVIDYKLTCDEPGRLKPLRGTEDVIKSILVDTRLREASYFVKDPLRGFDIVTLEPAGLTGTNLKNVLDILYRSGHVYIRIHCNFCRNKSGTIGKLHRPDHV